MPHVVVAGAGLSGLAVAFYLKRLRPDLRVTLLEARGRPGGNLGTLAESGFTVEAGPNGFLDGKPGMVHLCRAVGLGDQLIPASEGSRKNRYVFVRDNLHKLPGSPFGLLTTPLLSPVGKLELLSEPFRRQKRVRGDESVGAFARRRFGKEAADIFVDALVTGIHAGDPDRLSVAAAFPRLPLFERKHGSVIRGFLAASGEKRRAAKARGEKSAPQRMWSFPGGLQTLVDALGSAAGDSVISGVTVRSIEASRRVQPPGLPPWVVRGDGPDAWPADAVVLTTPAPEQAAAVADLDPGLSADLAAIRYTKVAVVALGYRSADAPVAPDGFGYIAPGNTRRAVLGVQWCSAIFPGRAPPGHVLWRALCGGASRPDVFDLPDDALIRECHREVTAAMGVTAGPVFTRVVRWPRAIPQYEVGHPARVLRIEAAAARHPGLFLSGNSFRGVAMNDVAEQAEVVAGAVAGYLRPNR